MTESIENKHGPCKEKWCARCCDPVKISFKKGYDPSKIPVPKDSDGNPLRIAKDEIWAPEIDIDTKRVQIYDCLLYDKDNKNCKDYENRPKICRNTSYIDNESKESIDKQHKETIKTIFIKMKK